MNRRGFTLLEVLIAVAVLAVVVSAVALTQVSTFKVTRGSEQTSVAVQGAVDELNSLRRDVLAGDAPYWTSCDGTASGCQASFTASGGVSGTYAIYSGPNIPAGSVGGTPIAASGWSYSAQGLVLIVVDVTEPAPAHVTTYVSCIDRTQPPTISDPSTCPGFAPPGGG